VVGGGGEREALEGRLIGGDGAGGDGDEALQLARGGLLGEVLDRVVDELDWVI